MNKIYCSLNIGSDIQENCEFESCESCIYSCDKELYEVREALNDNTFVM